MQAHWEYFYSLYPLNIIITVLCNYHSFTFIYILGSLWPLLSLILQLELSWDSQHIVPWLWFITLKGYKAELHTWGKMWRKAGINFQVSSSLKSYKTCLMPPATSCDMYRILLIRKAHQRPSVKGSTQLANFPIIQLSTSKEPAFSSLICETTNLSY